MTTTTPRKRTPGRCETCGTPVPPPKRKCSKCKRATRRAARARASRRFVPFSRGAAGPSFYRPYDPERLALMSEDDRARMYDAAETGGL